MNGFGGMLSFELNSAISNPEVFLRALKLIKPAVSLGGVDSIISAPCRTSHAKMAEQDRLRIGIKQNLLRLSVGIEESADLIADIEQALFLASKK